MAIIKAFTKEYFRELKIIRRRPIIFFNGCFDIIHSGHISLINNVKNIAKIKYPHSNPIIICGLNSDDSVESQNKSHPLINNENLRAELIKNLGIDYVIIFDEENPLNLIMNIVPDIVVKGSDYKNKDFYEKIFLVNANIDIYYVDLVKGFSTTNIYNKIYSKAKEELRLKLEKCLNSNI